jgi:hypothetical protein
LGALTASHAWSFLHVVVHSVVGDHIALLRYWSTVYYWNLAITQVLYVVHVHFVEQSGVLAVLGLVVDVDLQAIHLVFQLLLLLSLFSSQLLGFFFLLLHCLNLSEVVEDVLVMQNGVRELVLEVVFVEKCGDSLLDKINLQDLVDGWSLARVCLKHHF